MVRLGLPYWQQPFWGVGRLRLSLKGCREPHTDKCNDLRLFCIHTKNLARFFAEWGKLLNYNKEKICSAQIVVVK